MARSFCSDGQHVVRLRIDRDAGDFAFARADFAGERIDFADGFDLAAPEFDADGEIVIGRIDFDRVAANAEGAAAEIFAAFILDFDELAKNRFARDGVAFFEHEHHAVVGFGRADAVDAGDGGDDDDVAALEKRASGAHAQLVELVVDGGFFFDVGVAGRNVGFGLVVVVVADEIFDGVRREERAKFVEELGSESLVVREHDCGAIDLLDQLRDGESLAGAGDAEEHLMAVAVVHTADELGDGFGLVAARLVVTG